MAGQEPESHRYCGRLFTAEEIQRIRFQARIDEVQEYMTEEQLQQMRRARTMGG